MIHFYPYVFLFTTYISGHFRLAVTVVWCILYVIKLAAFYLLAFINHMMIGCIDFTVFLSYLLSLNFRNYIRKWWSLSFHMYKLKIYECFLRGFAYSVITMTEVTQHTWNRRDNNLLCNIIHLKRDACTQHGDIHGETVEATCCDWIPIGGRVCQHSLKNDSSLWWCQCGCQYSGGGQGLKNGIIPVMANLHDHFCSGQLITFIDNSIKLLRTNWFKPIAVSSRKILL